MEALFNINRLDLDLNPRFFFYLGIYLAIAIIFYQGYKKGFSFAKWTLVVSFSVICALIGSKLIKFNYSDWKALTSLSEWSYDNGISFIGWMIGIMLGGIMSARLLRLPKGGLDAIAFAWPIGLIFVRVGCMLAGCCYGTETNLFLSIHYDGCSEKIHPTQFYEILVCISLIAFTYYFSRNKYLKKPDNLGLFTLLYYAFFRFFIEFIRAGGVEFMGLTLTQWILFAAMVILSLYLYITEKRYSPSKVLKTANENSESFLLGMILILTIFSLKILSYHELILLFSILLILLFTYVQKMLFKTADYKIFRNQLALVSLSILLMSQSSVTDTTITKYENSIWVGSVSGEYTSCGEVYPYNIKAINYEGKYNIDNKNSLLFSTGYYRTNDDNLLNHGFYQTLGYNHPYYKIAGGIIVEPWEENWYDPRYEMPPAQKYRLAWLVLPTIDIRVGKKLFMEGKVCQPLYGSIYDWNAHMHLGLGYNHNNLTQLSAGFSNFGFYLDSYFYLDYGIFISPYLSFGKKDHHAFGGKIGFRFPNRAIRKPKVIEQ